MQAVILQNLREKAELSTWPSKRIKKSPAASRLVEPRNATDAKKVPLLRDLVSPEYFTLRWWCCSMHTCVKGDADDYDRTLDLAYHV